MTDATAPRVLGVRLIGNAAVSFVSVAPDYADLLPLGDPVEITFTDDAHHVGVLVITTAQFEEYHGWAPRPAQVRPLPTEAPIDEADRSEAQRLLASLKLGE